MRVFVAGAADAIGRRLVPLLLSQGHDVRYDAVDAEGSTSPAPGRKRHHPRCVRPQGAPGIYNIAEEDGAVSIDKARRELGWEPDFRLN
jgi:nucleoside-diphosphate-sugar epimerase